MKLTIQLSILCACLWLTPGASLAADAGQGVEPCYASLKLLRQDISRFEQERKPREFRKQACEFLYRLDQEDPYFTQCAVPSERAEQISQWKKEVQVLALKQGVSCPKRKAQAFMPSPVSAPVAALPAALAGASGSKGLRARLDKFYSNAKTLGATAAAGPQARASGLYAAVQNKKLSASPQASAAAPKAVMMANVPPTSAFKAPLKKAKFYLFVDAIEDAALRAILSHEWSKKLFLRAFGTETRTLYRGINKYDLEKIKANNGHYPPELLYKFAIPDKSVAAAYAKQKEGSALIAITTTKAIPYYKLTRFWNLFAKMGAREYIYLTDGTEEIVQLPLQD